MITVFEKWVKWKGTVVHLWSFDGSNWNVEFTALPDVPYVEVRTIAL